MNFFSCFSISLYVFLVKASKSNRYKLKDVNHFLRDFIKENIYDIESEKMQIFYRYIVPLYMKINSPEYFLREIGEYFQIINPNIEYKELVNSLICSKLKEKENSEEMILFYIDIKEIFKISMIEKCHGLGKDFFHEILIEYVCSIIKDETEIIENLINTTEILSNAEKNKFKTDKDNIIFSRNVFIENNFFIGDLIRFISLEVSLIEKPSFLFLRIILHKEFLDENTTKILQSEIFHNNPLLAYDLYDKIEQSNLIYLEKLKNWLKSDLIKFTCFYFYKKTGIKIRFIAVYSTDKDQDVTGVNPTRNTNFIKNQDCEDSHQNSLYIIEMQNITIKKLLKETNCYLDEQENIYYEEILCDIAIKKKNVNNISVTRIKNIKNEIHKYTTNVQNNMMNFQNENKYCDVALNIDLNFNSNINSIKDEDKIVTPKIIDRSSDSNVQKPINILQKQHIAESSQKNHCHTYVDGVKSINVITTSINRENSIFKPNEKVILKNFDIQEESNINKKATEVYKKNKKLRKEKNKHFLKIMGANLHTKSPIIYELTCEEEKEYKENMLIAKSNFEISSENNNFIEGYRNGKKLETIYSLKKRLFSKKVIKMNTKKYNANIRKFWNLVEYKNKIDFNLSVKNVQKNKILAYKNEDLKTSMEFSSDILHPDIRIQNKINDNNDLNSIKDTNNSSDLYLQDKYISHTEEHLIINYKSNDSEDKNKDINITEKNFTTNKSKENTKSYIKNVLTISNDFPLKSDLISKDLNYKINKSDCFENEEYNQNKDNTENLADSAVKIHFLSDFNDLKNKELSIEEEKIQEKSISNSKSYDLIATKQLTSKKIEEINKPTKVNYYEYIDNIICDLSTIKFSKYKKKWDLNKIKISKFIRKKKDLDTQFRCISYLNDKFANNIPTYATHLYDIDNHLIYDNDVVFGGVLLIDVSLTCGENILLTINYCYDVKTQIYTLFAQLGHITTNNEIEKDKEDKYEVFFLYNEFDYAIFRKHMFKYNKKKYIINPSARILNSLYIDAIIKLQEKTGKFKIIKINHTRVLFDNTGCTSFGIIYVK